jgi:uncharacterized protein
MTEGAVIIFARTPELGRVKTRLASTLGEEHTLELYRAFLEDSLELARRSGAEVILARTQGGSFPEERLADRVVLQEGESFGERMDGVLLEVSRTIDADRPYLILGADAPHLPPGIVAHVLAKLRSGGSTAALGRCQEGGFYLLGFRGEPVPIKEAFDGPDEATRVANLLARAGRAPFPAPEFYDIDTPADLAQLWSALRGPTARGAPEWVPPATLRCLRELGPIVAPARTEPVAVR